jgi:hypothetical protein
MAEAILVVALLLAVGAGAAQLWALWRSPSVRSFWVGLAALVAWAVASWAGVLAYVLLNYCESRCSWRLPSAPSLVPWSLLLGVQALGFWRALHVLRQA